MNTLVPLVSICCITYNHENYIGDAIEGFLMQKANFPIEIIIHDDASTDGTASIISKYAQKSPNLIHPIFQTENQYLKTSGKISAMIVWPHARGKYLALCEGDDYWTDPLKLQKQVDFLELNPEYSVSFHATKHIWVNSGLTRIHRFPCKNGFRSFAAKDVILGGGSFMKINSMVFRSEYVKNLPDWYYLAPTGDIPLSLLLSIKGRVAYFDDIMSVYRIAVPGSWSENMKGIHHRKALIHKTEKMLLSFNRSTNNKYVFSVLRKILKNRIDLMLYPILVRK